MSVGMCEKEQPFQIVIKIPLSIVALIRLCKSQCKSTVLNFPKKYFCFHRCFYPSKGTQYLLLFFLNVCKTKLVMVSQS